ncbi:MAG: IPT/TIG domain-containing protein [Gemmatimonadetes bacterium]|nr:IPT/TIG domain-containing protein [Gemmatimonadota bacterium]
MADIIDIIAGRWTGTYTDRNNQTYQIEAEILLDGAGTRIHMRYRFSATHAESLTGDIVMPISASQIDYTWREGIRRGKGRWTQTSGTTITGSWGNADSLTDLGSYALTKQAVAQPATPSVSAISPVGGPVTGGISIKIEGQGLADVTSVDIGTQSVPRSNLTVVNDTTLVVPVPAVSQPTTVTVKVNTPAGASATSAQTNFVYMHGFLFQPQDQPNFEWPKVRRYFGLQDSATDFQQAIDWVYGGQRLTYKDTAGLMPQQQAARTKLDFFAMRIVDAGQLLLDIDIYKVAASQAADAIRIRNMSWRQLVPESSKRPAANSTWENINDPQARLEICQMELARWSVVLKEGGQVQGQLSITGDAWCKKIEIVNNCTTSWGFEVKITDTNDVGYHASITLPQEQYFALCRAQAGAESRQGFDPPAGVPQVDSRLAFPNNSPTFKDVYYAAEHARADVTLDMDRYRTVTATPVNNQDINVSQGNIDYQRLRPANSEYFEKPHVRHLVMRPDATQANPRQFLVPPTTYAAVQANTPGFMVPSFWPNGVYMIPQPTELSHYTQLRDLKKWSLHRTDVGLYEIVLARDPTPGNQLELHHVVLGNLDLRALRTNTGLYTLDRFCYAARHTSTDYDPAWRPAILTTGGVKRARYGALLGGRQGTTARYVFVLPEAYGVERAVLQFTNPTTLIIDLISYERIVPVWQGTLTLPQNL